MTLAILGAGRIGQAMARRLGGKATLWVWGDGFRSEDFPGCQHRDTVGEACAEAHTVVITVSVRRLRMLAQALGEVARGDQVVLLTTRGVEPGFGLPAQVLREETCIRKIGILGGPLPGPERDAQAAPLVVASRFPEVAEIVQQLAGSAAVVYPTRDVTGVQVASAVANVTAIALGMAAALQFGDMAQAVLLTRGLAEAARLGQVLGAEQGTFTGLAGVGSLMPRQLSPHERHVELGRYLASGMPPQDAVRTVARDVDGVRTAQEAVRLAQAHRLDIPLVTAMAEVMAGGLEPAAALAALFQRGFDFGSVGAAR